MSVHSAEDPLHAPMLITGANRNVGAALAHALLDDGLPVLAHYRSHTRAIDDLEARGAMLVQADFGQRQHILDFVSRVAGRVPRLCGIIHNASGFQPTAAGLEAAAEQFEAFFAVHMLAPFLITRGLTPALNGTREKPANIIAITDIYSDNPSPEHDIYCATKAGLQNLVLSLARSLAPTTRVNAIQPGPIDFPEGYSEQARQAVLADTPLQRTGGANAIVAAVRAILANDFMTGAVIPVDGGRRLGTKPC